MRPERAQLTAFLSQVVIPFPAILTQRPIVQRIAELYHIEDEAMIDSLITLGKQLMQGQLPMPGDQQGGGPPGGTAIAQLMGMAGGPAGGNANGGGQ